MNTHTKTPGAGHAEGNQNSSVGNGTIANSAENSSVPTFSEAFSVASQGYPVFPVDPKTGRPFSNLEVATLAGVAVPPEGEGGFKLASTDPVIVKIWADKWPDAQIGIPTGTMTNICCLDIDRKDGRDGFARCERNGWLIPEAPRETSRSGKGAHILFSMPEGGLSCAINYGAEYKGDGTGVDRKADGGYFIWCGVDLSAPRPPAPHWLLSHRGHDRSVENTGPMIQKTDEQIALELTRNLEAVREAVKGERHDILNKASFEIGQLAALRLDRENEWEQALQEAIADYEQPCDFRHAYSTIKRGIRDGKKDPKRAPDPAKLFGNEHPTLPAGAAPLTVAPTSPPPRALPFFNAAELQGQSVPPREWLVSDLVPMHTVTLLGGDGGTGKSLLALQLAVGVSANRAWLNNMPSPGRALYLSAEDDRDELHRRLSDIRRNMRLEWANLSGLTILPLAGEDALLAHEQIGKGLTPSPLFREIEKRVASEKPRLVVLDTSADLFPGNENDRTEVRQFVGILRGLAIRHGCAVVLLSHPSLTGMSTGTGASGSTAWNNSVRSRLYLERVKDNGHEGDPDLRVLTSKKANYGPVGNEVHMVWQAGTFTRVNGASTTEATAEAERVFLNLLRLHNQQGRYVNATSGQRFAPTVFSKHADREGITKNKFREAMDALFNAGKIKNGEVGRGSKVKTVILEGK
jgi:RecA-family ATPase